jgi:AcrR family transcriptional regulator
MEDEPQHMEGTRARKRRLTRARIAEQGLKLFVENGYDATTLEAVAEAAAISPRTLFHHFKTKDEILQFWKGPGFVEEFRPTLLAEPVDQTPLDAVRNTILKLISRYETENTVVVDRILNATEALRVRKHVFYIEMEQMVFAALCGLWPAPERRPELRMSAMMAIGTMRLAMESRRNDTGNRPLAAHMDEAFHLLADVRLRSMPSGSPSAGAPEAPSDLSADQPPTSAASIGPPSSG